jgi:hypothetical protein
MFTDEQKFSVNGSAKKHLFKTLELALEMADFPVAAYQLTDHGIILFWKAVEDSNKLPKTTNVETIGNLVWDQLNDSDVKILFRQNVKYTDIDGDVNVGWVVTHPSYYSMKNAGYVIAKVELDWLYYSK